MPPKASIPVSPPDAHSYQRIFESMPGQMMLLSAELTILVVNEETLRATNTRREQLVGQHFLAAFPETAHWPTSQRANRLPETLNQVLTTGKQHQTEAVQYDLPDPENPGSYRERHWNTTNTPVPDAKGRVQYIIFQAVDVTEQVLAARRLKESQEREKALVAHAERQRDQMERFLREIPAGICSLAGPDFVYDFVNPTYQNQLFPGREILGKTLFEAVPEVADQPIAEVLRQVYQTGQTIEGKEVLVPLAPYEGAPLQDHYFNYIQQARLDEQGNTKGILSFAYDITALVLARQEVEKVAEALRMLNQELEEHVENRTRELRLAQSEAVKQKERLEGFFLQAPAAICVLTGPEMVYELVNPRYQQMFPGRRLQGLPVLQALPEIWDTPIWQGLCQVYETGQTLEAREILVPMARNGIGPKEDIFFNYILQARFDEQGHVDGIMVVAHDVTDQVQALRQVEQSESLLHLALEAGHMATFDLDLRTNQTTRSRDHDRLFGYEANLPEWNMETLLLHMQPEDRPEVVAQFENSLEKGVLWLSPRIRRTTGELRWIEGRGKVRYDEAGQPVRISGVVTDVTERKLTEQQLQSLTSELATANAELALANQELRVANAEIRASYEELGATNQQLTRTNVDLDNFIYTASHDLKAPIFNIEGLMKNLLHELPPETLQDAEVQSIANMIQTSVDRFKKTIANLTEVSKLQQDNNKEATSVVLADLVSEVTLDLEQHLRESGTRLEVDVQACPTISFSEKNLRSIVYNLLSNAIKYRSPDRNPWVRLSCQLEKGFAVLKVQDNGLGINPKQEQQMYTMFKRFHDHVEGTGIGLYMVKKIIENAGGTIALQSKLGVGSTFKVYFPR